MKYDIASAESHEYARDAIEELLETVQEMVNDGWKPIGAANAIVVPSEEGMLPKITFFQTLVREDREDEEDETDDSE